MQDGARILEVGAGDGALSLDLARRNPRATVTGVDYSGMQVRRAERKRRRIKADNCFFQRTDAMELSFQDGAFDAAVSIGSIKHWPDGLCGLREMHRVLKPGGVVFIAETDQQVSDDALMSFVRRFKIWFAPERVLFWGLRNVVFGQSYSEASLASLLREAGFADLKCRRLPTVPYVIIRACRA